MLKFLTCGSVDDGKSTLIGHMLYDAKLLFADQKQALELDSKAGSADGGIDYSLLLDGLMAEREQGITIDVAYRYFATQKRSFIVADTPGHEEYTRNMAVGASFAELAVILLDAAKGVLLQTRRHTRICSLMGIRDFVFAVNKMDQIGYDAGRFEELARDIRTLMAEFPVHTLQIIPVSAVKGDNVTERSGRMPWYDGLPLLPYLESVETDRTREGRGFCLPVQRICRPNQSFRGFMGGIKSGEVCVGDEVTVLPSRERAHVKEIRTGFDSVQRAAAGQPVNLTLDREIDVSRGCVIEKESGAHVGNLFAASVLWMDEELLIPGKSYLLKLGTRKVPCTVQKIRYQTDINTGEHLPAQRVCKNGIACCEVLTAENIVLDRFENSRTLGGFILIDRITDMTSGCGVVEEILTRNTEIYWQELDITREIRARQMNQTPITLWFTGLSGSGKSTIANALEKRLAAMGRHTMLLDGDNVRFGLNKDLGFDQAGRIENIRRIAEVCRLMNDAGLIVLTSFISPFAADRKNAREIIGESSFAEIYVSAPLETCEKRDVKGLYRRARVGEIQHFTGISSPYEAPEKPEITIDTKDCTVEEAVEMVLKYLSDHDAKIY